MPQQPRSSDPGAFAWSLALVSLVLPWLGAGLALLGTLRVIREDPYGWPLLGAGVVVLVLDWGSTSRGHGWERRAATSRTSTGAARSRSGRR